MLRYGSIFHDRRKWHKQRNRENIKLARCPGPSWLIVRFFCIPYGSRSSLPSPIVTSRSDWWPPPRIKPSRVLKEPYEIPPIPSTFQRGTIIGLGWVGRSWDARAIAWQEKMHLKNKYKKKGSSHSLHARYGLCDSRWVLRSKPGSNFSFPILLQMSLHLLSTVRFSPIFHCTIPLFFFSIFFLFVTYRNPSRLMKRYSSWVYPWCLKGTSELSTHNSALINSYSLYFGILSTNLSRWRIPVKEIYSSQFFVEKLHFVTYSCSKNIHLFHTNSRFLWFDD